MDIERSKFIVFFAWQSDTDQVRTTDAIRHALKVASNKLKDELKINVFLEEATREVSGPHTYHSRSSVKFIHLTYL